VVTVSTDFLAEKAREFCGDVRVVRNGLSEAFIKRADAVCRARQARAGSQEAVVIGYCSGSPYHDEDFSQLVPVLADLLDQNRHLSIRLVGKIEVPRQLSRFDGRVVARPFIPYQEFPGVYRDIDINLAPLQFENPLALGRSEIKFIEAGACAVPTAATPSGAYRQAIVDGVNGILVEPDGWHAGLKWLIDHPAERNAIGAAARETVLGNYSAVERSREWGELMPALVREHQPVTRLSGSRGEAAKQLGIMYFHQRRKAVRTGLKKRIRAGSPGPDRGRNRET
jgi:glycosyltransferase involved in cell wall biosynthesis